MQTPYRHPGSDLRSVNARPKPVARTNAGRRIDPVGSLRRHWMLALLAGVGIVAVGIPAAWHMGRTRYKAEAVVYVSPQFIRNLEGDEEQRLQSNSQYREFVQQQARTINRYDIIVDVLQRLGPQKSLWQKAGESDRRAAERLQGALEIAPVPDTYQITVALEGAKPEGLAEIVNTVVQAYLAIAKEEEFFASGPRAEKLREESSRLSAEIQAKYTRRSEIAQLLGVTNFTESYPNPYDQLLVNRKSSLAEARLRRIEAEAMLLTSGTEDGGTALRASAEELVAKDPGLTSLKASLNQRRSELLTRMSGLSPAHPGRKAVEQELREISDAIEDTSAALTREQLSGIIAQRRAAVARAKGVEDRISVEVELEASRAEWFARHYQDALALGAELDRDRRRLNAIEDRLDMLALEASAPGFIRSFSQARTPEIPIRGGRKKLLAMVLVAAFVVAICTPVAVDFFDPRVLTPADIERVAGFPPMSVIPVRSASTEAYIRNEILRIATKIDRDWRTHNSTVFVFTGSIAAAGVTTIVLELHNALRSMGVRSGAVEANSVSPDHRFGSGRLTLTDAAIRMEAITTLKVDEPLLPVGDVPGGHLPSLDRVRSVLRHLATVWDVVLVDAPALSASADAEFLCGAADATVLVVDAMKTDSAALRRTVGVLEGANPGAVAVIQNRVAPELLAPPTSVLKRLIWSAS